MTQLAIGVVAVYFAFFYHLLASCFSVKEANDACLWLKAAGFPQYVQMFEGQYSALSMLKVKVLKFPVKKCH